MNQKLKQFIRKNMVRDFGKSITEKSISRIKFETFGEYAPLEKQIPLDDKETLSLFQTGKTAGTTNFRFYGMRRLLKDAKPANLNELAAMIALWRPGPLESG
ncbi:MAG: hypothetical protein ABIC39_05790, partial [Pseudomonadota bacterium]